MKEALSVVHVTKGVRYTNRVAVKANTPQEAAPEIVAILADTYNVATTDVQIVSIDLADGTTVTPAKTEDEAGGDDKKPSKKS